MSTKPPSGAGVKSLGSTPDSEQEPEWIPEKYQHDSTRGVRLPGWEDLNTTLLAEDVGICKQHIRQVLTGRKGGRVWVLQKIARCLCISLDELVHRRDKSMRLDRKRDQEKENKPKFRRLK